MRPGDLSFPRNDFNDPPSHLTYQSHRILDALVVARPRAPFRKQRTSARSSSQVAKLSVASKVGPSDAKGCLAPSRTSAAPACKHLAMIGCQARAVILA